MSFRMNIELFLKKCNEWSHPSWNNGNLIKYWERGGLNPEKIFKNKKKLEHKTNTLCVFGSVGKTTLSKVLFDIINTAGFSAYINRVNDNWVPQLPFAVELAIRKGVDFGVFECGVASKGDASLMSMILPAKGIVYSQFERVHLSQLINLEGVVNEKVQFALENPNIQIVSHIKNRIYLEERGFNKVIYYGEKGSNSSYNYQVTHISEDGTDIIVESNKRRIKFRIDEIGLHLGPACAGALATYETFVNKINERSIEIKNRVRTKQRMNKYLYHGTTFLVDTANANDCSILNSLKSFIALDTKKKKNAVIGEIYGLGNDTERIIKELSKKMSRLDLSVFSSICFIGEDYFKNRDILKSNFVERIEFYKNEQEFISSFNVEDYKGQIVLLRGPTRRGVNLSRILKNYDGTSDETRPEELIK